MTESWRRLGKLRISSDILLNLLDYPDAICRGVSYDVEYNTVDIILESLEMPRVNEGDAVPDIMPTYIKHTDSVGHSVSIRRRHD